MKRTKGETFIGVVAIVANWLKIDAVVCTKVEQIGRYEIYDVYDSASKKHYVDVCDTNDAMFPRMCDAVKDALKEKTLMRG